MDYENSDKVPTPDKMITKSEWNDYYSAVSASIDNDEHFVELMRTAWRLD